MNRPARNIQRRQEIVATAWKLISERGYDATSLNSLIAEMGISKGSLYHHFQSKAAVVDAVVEMLTQEVTERVAADNEGASALERLCAFLRSGWEWHESHRTVSTQIFYVMLKPENSELRQRVSATEQCVCQPLLEDIITQGIEAGVFLVPNPRLPTELILPMLSDGMVRIIRQAVDNQFDARGVLEQLEFLQYALEQVLGAPPNSVQGALPLTDLSCEELQAFITQLKNLETT